MHLHNTCLRFYTEDAKHILHTSHSVTFKFECFYIFNSYICRGGTRWSISGQPISGDDIVVNRWAGSVYSSKPSLCLWGCGGPSGITVCSRFTGQESERCIMRTHSYWSYRWYNSFIWLLGGGCFDFKQGLKTEMKKEVVELWMFIGWCFYYSYVKGSQRGQTKR